MSPALGYVHDDPAAVASQTSDKHWNMALLMEAVPVTVAPPRYLVPDLRPAALDQDGIGACTVFAGCLIRDTQEVDDVGAGKHIYATGSYAAPKSGAFLGYEWLKSGHGSYPGDGLPGVEGSYPEQVWKLARAEGLPDARNVPHKIAAYYAHSFGSDADLAFLQGVLMEYGPVNVATPWAGNWMTAPNVTNEYRMPPPGGMVGGHSFTIVGWETYAGTIYLTCMNSWGYWGSEQGLFRFPAAWLYAAPLGPQIVWKTVDQEDAPVASLAIVDKLPRLLDTALGAQIWKTDGTTPLAKVSSGNTGIASSAQLSGNHYAVIVSVGGILQLGAVKAADCTNVRPAGGDTAAAEAKGAKAVKDAAIAEALLHGG